MANNLLLPDRLGTQRTARVFVSSGDDAVNLRERFDDLISVVNPLLQERADAHITVKKWEHAPAQVTPEGVIEKFVAQAVASDLTLVLLIDELRPGTRAEVEAVLDSGGRLSILWFNDRDNVTANQDLIDFLDSIRTRVLYAQVGRPEADSAWLGMVKHVTAIILDLVLADPREVLVEAR